MITYDTIYTYININLYTHTLYMYSAFRCNDYNILTYTVIYTNAINSNTINPTVTNYYNAFLKTQISIYGSKKVSYVVKLNIQT